MLTILAVSATDVGGVTRMSETYRVRKHNDGIIFPYSVWRGDRGYPWDTLVEVTTTLRGARRVIEKEKRRKLIPTAYGEWVYRDGS